MKIKTIVHFITNKEVLMTQSDVLKKLGPLAEKHFCDDVRKEFWHHARSEYDGDKMIAAAIFSVAWTALVIELITEKIPISLEDALDFFNFYLEDKEMKERQIGQENGSFPNYVGIWSKILYDDMDNFVTLQRMRSDLLWRTERTQATTEKATKKIDREALLRRKIRQAFMTTSRKTFGDYDRMQFVFFEDLKRLIIYLQEKNIATTVNELSNLIEAEVATVKGRRDLLGHVRTFKESLASIIPVDDYEEEPDIIEIVEITDAVDAYEQAEAAEIVTPIEVEEVIPRVDVMSTVIEQQEMHAALIAYDISLAGLIKAIRTIEYFDDINTYNKQMQELYFKIMIQCRDNKIQFGLLRKVVYELKEYLMRKKGKMGSDPENYSPEDQKFLLILGTIGPFEAKISELMPSTFVAHDTCKIV